MHSLPLTNPRRAIDGISDSFLVSGAGRGSAHAPCGSFLWEEARERSLPSPSCLTPSGKESFGACRLGDLEAARTGSGVES